MQFCKSIGLHVNTLIILNGKLSYVQVYTHAYYHTYVRMNTFHYFSLYSMASTIAIIIVCGLLHQKSTATTTTTIIVQKKKKKKGRKTKAKRSQ